LLFFVKNKPMFKILTGIVPGFISMNFYFPKDKMSVIVLQNVAWPDNMFYYHQQVLKLAHGSVSGKQ
jgi:D-alanyl-D-alanine carboxypeptidase